MVARDVGTNVLGDPEGSIERNATFRTICYRHNDQAHGFLEARLLGEYYRKSKAGVASLTA